MKLPFGFWVGIEVSAYLVIVFYALRSKLRLLYIAVRMVLERCSLKLGDTLHQLHITRQTRGVRDVGTRFIIREPTPDEIRLENERRYKELQQQIDNLKKQVNDKNDTTTPSGQLVTNVGAAQTALRLTNLSPQHWLMAIAVPFAAVFWLEIRKAVRAYLNREKSATH